MLNELGPPRWAYLYIEYIKERLATLIYTYIHTYIYFAVKAHIPSKQPGIQVSHCAIEHYPSLILTDY